MSLDFRIIYFASDKSIAAVGFLNEFYVTPDQALDAHIGVDPGESWQESSKLRISKKLVCVFQFKATCASYPRRD